MSSKRAHRRIRDDDGLGVLPGVKKSKRITLVPSYARPHTPPASHHKSPKGLNAKADAAVAQLLGRQDRLIQPQRRHKPAETFKLPRQTLPDLRTLPAPSSRLQPSLLWASHSPPPFEEELINNKYLMQPPPRRPSPSSVFDTPMHSLYAHLEPVIPSPTHSQGAPFEAKDLTRCFELRRSASADSVDVFQFKPPPSPRQHQADTNHQLEEIHDEAYTHFSDASSLSAVGIGGLLEDPFNEKTFDVYEDA